MGIMFTTVDDAIAAYDEFLDEYTVQVAGLTFAGSRVVRELDPTAYRVGFHDWLDSEGIDSDDLEGDWSSLP